MTDLCVSPVRCYNPWQPAQSGVGGVSVPNALYYRVAGNISRLGVAGSYKVRLHLRSNGILYAETWSNEAGEYLFELVPPEPCYVVALDHTGNPVNAAISDYVTPEPMA